MAQLTLRSHSCWLYSGQCCPLFPNQPSSPPTSVVAAGLGLVHDTVFILSLDARAHFLWGGFFLQLCPQTVSPCWVGMPATPGSPAGWQDGRGFVQSTWESEAYAPSILCFLSVQEQKGSDDRNPPPCSPAQPAFGLHTHTHFPYRAFAGLLCSSSPYYQRTSVSSRPVLCHS